MSTTKILYCKENNTEWHFELAIYHNSILVCDVLETIDPLFLAYLGDEVNSLAELNEKLYSDPKRKMSTTVLKLFNLKWRYNNSQLFIEGKDFIKFMALIISEWYSERVEK